MSWILEDIRNLRERCERLENPQKGLDAQLDRQELRLVALQSSMEHRKLERDEMKLLGEVLNRNENDLLTQ